MPELQKVADELADRGVALVTVVTGGPLARVASVVERRGLRAPVILADGPIMQTWRVDAVPWTVLIDRQGKAREALRGGYDAETFRKLALSAL